MPLLNLSRNPDGSIRVLEPAAAAPPPRTADQLEQDRIWGLVELACTGDLATIPPKDPTDEERNAP